MSAPNGRSETRCCSGEHVTARACMRTRTCGYLRGCESFGAGSRGTRLNIPPWHSRCCHKGAWTLTCVRREEALAELQGAYSDIDAMQVIRPTLLDGATNELVVQAPHTRQPRLLPDWCAALFCCHPHRHSQPSPASGPAMHLPSLLVPSHRPRWQTARCMCGSCGGGCWSSRSAARAPPRPRARQRRRRLRATRATVQVRLVHGS